MKEWLADLHLHSLLSPCGEIEMTPHHIVMRAAEFGVDMIALTDHNASANVAPAIEAAQEFGIRVMPGMEVQCREEGHIIVLFDEIKQLEDWQRQVDAAMQPLANDPVRFGAQFIVDADDNFVAEEERMLLAPLALSAEAVVETCNRLGGICIAAHIDRASYSLLGQLGFLPRDLGLAAAEISQRGIEELQRKALQPLTGGLPYITSSDAHRIEDFRQGPKTSFCLAEPTVAEIRLALRGEGERCVKPGCYIGKKT